MVVNVLALATGDEPVSILAERLEQGARRQLAWLAAEAVAAPPPSAYHFRPFAAMPWLPMTVVYPAVDTPADEAAQGSLARAWATA